MTPKAGDATGFSGRDTLVGVVFFLGALSLLGEFGNNDQLLFHLSLLFKLQLFDAVYIDVVAGILPVLVSLLLVIYLVRRRTLRFKYYLAWLLPTFLAFIHYSAVTPSGLYISGVPSFLVGIFALLLVYNADKSRIVIDQDSVYPSSLIIGYSYATLGGFFADFAFLPTEFSRGAMSVYIGGRGFDDGIFVSGIMAVLVAVIIQQFLEITFQLTLTRTWRRIRMKFTRSENSLKSSIRGSRRRLHRIHDLLQSPRLIPFNTPNTLVSGHLRNSYCCSTSDLAGITLFSPRIVQT